MSFRSIRRPVIIVSWAEAKRYVEWLSRKTEKNYRLLSEAEWEYVARAGATRYGWDEQVGRNNANCDGCGSQWSNKQTAPVGSFDANAFGLHDTAGNVWEWVEDCYNDSYKGAPDVGSAWTEGQCDKRVLRGGSWDSWALSVAYRFGTDSGYRSISIGFRVARTLDR